MCVFKWKSSKNHWDIIVIAHFIENNKTNVHNEYNDNGNDNDNNNNNNNNNNTLHLKQIFCLNNIKK